MKIMESTCVSLNQCACAGLVATFEQAADCYEGKQTKRGAIKIVLKSTGWGIVIGGALGAAIAAGLAVLSTSGAAVVAAAAGVYSGAFLKQTTYLCQHKQKTCCFDMVLVTELQFQLCPIRQVASPSRYQQHVVGQHICNSLYPKNQSSEEQHRLLYCHHAIQGPHV